MENEVISPEKTHNTVVDAAPICDCCGEELTLEDIEALEAEEIKQVEFIGSLLQCRPQPDPDPFTLQNDLIRLPEPEEPFALPDYCVTLSCLLSVPDCGHTGHYFPVTASLQDDLWPWIKVITFNLAVNSDGGVFLIPEDEDGDDPDEGIDLASALQMAESQPIMIERNQHDTFEVAIADVDIDTDISVDAFEELLRDAFQGFVIDDLDHPIIDVLLSDE